MDVEHRVYLIRMQLGEQKEVINELVEKINDPSYKMERAAINKTTIIEIEPFLAGVVSETEFLQDTTNSVSDPKVQKEQLCEAYYYVGMKHLILGDTNGATSFFQRCINAGPLMFGEEGYDDYNSAEAELRALKK